MGDIRRDANREDDRKLQARWSPDEHFTTFAKRLSREQKKLKNDSINISDADKKQHLMIQVWDRDLFDRAVMIKWSERPTIQKSFDHMVAYFTK